MKGAAGEKRNAVEAVFQIFRRLPEPYQKQIADLIRAGELYERAAASLEKQAAVAV